MSVLSDKEDRRTKRQWKQPRHSQKGWGKALCGGNSAQKAGEQSQNLAKEAVSFMLDLDFLHQNQQDSAKPTKRWWW